MTTSRHVHSKCCLCHSTGLELALSLEPSPIGDAFVTQANVDKPQPFLPLNVAVCSKCGHSQLREIVDPQEMFVDYLFQTGNSPGLVEHYRRFADTMRERLRLQPGDRVLEIGSNDGSLLQFFQQQGMKVQGVDPSRNAAMSAAARNVPTRNDFFTMGVSQELVRDSGPFRLVVANNVFAHSAELANMTEGISTALTADGVFVFEVSYLVDMVDRMLFDTVYHEHVSYHHLQPLVPFFRRFGLEIWDVERISSKGGSIRVYVQRSGGPRMKTAVVDDLLAKEEALGVSSPAYLQKFAEVLLTHRDKLHTTLKSLGVEPGTLSGYGASTTTTTLIAHFQLAPYLKRLVDDNPQKQGCFSPGWHHPVVPSQVLLDECPPFVIVLAWVFADAIIEKNQKYRAAGGRFIVPLPQISVR